MGTIPIFCDLSLCAFFAVWVILVELAIIPSNKRGFICGDISISFKFNGDTISTAMILSSIIIPFILMWIVEALRGIGQSSRICLWKRSLYISLNWYNKFLIGFSIHIAIIEAMKTLMGESRPHFLDTCRPDTAVNCTIGTYISDFTCTNTEVSAQLVNDSFRSFPSGHSSVGNFEGLFMAWYFLIRFPSFRCKWSVPLLQTTCFIWAATCGITRITDNRHHWWDVLFGGIIGLIFAAYTAKILCHNFRVISTRSSDDIESSSIHLSNNKTLLSVTTSAKDEMPSDTELLQVEYHNIRSATSTPLFNGYKKVENC
ncbi:phospholipid phosphatase homolog 1.2 homolog isoform X2 [Phlebotomus papatasi]|nr:phospholipid phosphatase homolog 1.2 homolog isoform X2 [Phlebotomus papatasi]